MDINLRTGPNYVDISWAPPNFDGGSPITAYLVYVVPLGLSWVGDYPDTAPPVATLPPEARTYRHTGLVPDLSYTFYMKAENAKGLSRIGGWEWAVPGKTVPSAPEVLPRIGNGTVWLTFNEGDQGGTKVLGFLVYRGIQPWNNSLIANVSIPYGATSGSYAEMGLANGQKYYYCVTYYNIMGEGPASSLVPATPRQSPTLLTAFPRYVDTCGPMVVLLNWSMPPEAMQNITGFNIYSQSVHVPVRISPENRSFVAHVEGGWGYAFSVSAVYDDGTESFSSQTYVNAPMCEGSLVDPLVYLIPMVFLLIFLTAFLVVWNHRRKRS